MIALGLSLWIAALGMLVSLPAAKPGPHTTIVLTAATVELLAGLTFFVTGRSELSRDTHINIDVED